MIDEEGELTTNSTNEIKPYMLEPMPNKSTVEVNATLMKNLGINCWQFFGM